MLRPNVGLPKFGTATTARNRIVSADGRLGPYLPGGGIIDGTKTRNPFNTDLSSTDSTPFRDLWPGLLMGRITASGKWANSCIGKSTGALTTVATTLPIGPYEATELVRRVGATGTFKLTGPPTAAGTVATSTVTYSAVNTSTGDVTITATGVAFVSGSLVQPTDGSETILSFVPDSWGEYIPEDSSDVPFSRIPAGGFITDSQLVPWPADASLKAYIRTALKAVGSYEFTVPLNG